ncbi:MAG: AgmX/PglI C-terminal domain-containing protein [Polyangiaceae bacterium]
MSGSATASPRNSDGTPMLDRARADAIRDRLKALYAQTPAASETAQNKPDPQYPVMPHDPAENDVLKEYIHQRIKDDYFPLAKSCYENALAKSPKLGGRLVMSFRIVGDRRVGGVVESADVDPSSTIQDDELMTCMKESMMAVSFDAPPNDQPVTVKYPIELSPDDGG